MTILASVIKKVINQVYVFSFYFRKPLLFDIKLLEILFPLVLFGVLKKRLILGRGFFVVLVFVFYIFLNFSFFSIYYGTTNGLLDVFRYIYAILAAVALLNIYYYEDDPYRDISKWFIRIGVFVCIACVVGFLTRGQYFSYFVSVSDSSWKPARAVGLDINPNYFSVYLMLLSSMVLADLSERRRLRLYFVFGIVLLGVASTLSRTVLVVIVFQILAFLFLAKNVGFLKKLVSAVVISISLLLMVFIGLGDAIVSRSEKTFEGDGDIRFVLWRAALENIIESPVFGVGFGRSSAVIEAETGYALTTHNQYVEHLLQIGMLGLMLFLFFHFYILLQCWRSYRAFGRKSTLCLLLFFLSCLVFYLGNTASTSRVIWFAVALFWIDQALLDRERIGRKVNVSNEILRKEA